MITKNVMSQEMLRVIVVLLSLHIYPGYLILISTFHLEKTWGTVGEEEPERIVIADENSAIVVDVHARMLIHRGADTWNSHNCENEHMRGAIFVNDPTAKV